MKVCCMAPAASPPPRQAKRYSHGVRLAKKYEMDSELTNLALKSTPAVMIDAADYLNEKVPGRGGGRLGDMRRYILGKCMCGGCNCAPSPPSPPLSPPPPSPPPTPRPSCLSPRRGSTTRPPPCT